jgi:ribonuclease E
MADKMLIDATHPEETRVVVLRGNRVEEFDFESANRKQLRGNIYLAKVTRVEPSLQAAFVDYGGNRHGFLAFSEIHPDYYQIPVADRQALIAQEESDARQADADADHRASRRGGGRNRHRSQRSERSRDPVRTEPVAGEEHHEQAADAEHHAEEHHADGAAPETGPETAAEIAETAAAMPTLEPSEAALEAQDAKDEAREAYEAPAGDIENTPIAERDSQMTPLPEGGDDHGESGDHLPPDAAALEAESAGTENHTAEPAPNGNGHAEVGEDHAEDEAVESVGGADALEEAQERAPRFRRNYKIQEVIKRRQVMLVQVVKEERGSKGAALTTYLSLAGRYSVLMPNTARGGGISRKITSGEDRSRLKEIAQELEVPEGMGVILRTAGASRTKLEVKRDFEYLLRQWETVRDLTLKSMAPKLVYEEGSLTKRSIRDLYSKEIDEIVVAGEAGYKEAREFMRMLMPSHAKHVKFYKDSTPLFTRYGIESQLDAMFSPTVQLRSGGYIVINQAEALVAIDVNSGRATREHHIEDTALKTNCEAADEVARQLRLRDLAGLIVIDFIDMDEGRNNRAVERRMKDALKHDRARIQVGRISHFGLLEMSRQRIRTSVLESSTEKCPVCGGSGHVRSVSSVALQLLRAVEEMLNKGATHNLIVRTRSEVALYVLNHKRAHLRALEERFRITITISADATVNAQVSYIVDRGELMHSVEAAKAIAATAPQMISTLDADEDILDAAAESEIEEDPEAGETFEGSGENNIEEIGGHEDAPDDTHAGEAVEHAGAGASPRDNERDGGRRRRRRGRGRGRGGEPREGGARENGAPRDSAQPYEPAPVQSIADGDLNGAAPDSEPAPHHEGAAPNGEGGDTPEGRRRRRRGRRGGRRNRQRNGEGPAPFNPNEAAPDAVGFPPVSEQDASGFAPPFDHGASAPVPAAPSSYAAAPEAKPAYAPVEAAPSQEPPRRRSTIREPAPIGASASAAPAAPPPAPVISVTATTEPATPKRGWWGKRLLGDKD